MHLHNEQHLHSRWLAASVGKVKAGDAAEGGFHKKQKGSGGFLPPHTWKVFTGLCLGCANGQEDAWHHRCPAAFFCLGSSRPLPERSPFPFAVFFFEGGHIPGAEKQKEATILGGGVSKMADLPVQA